MYKLLKGVSASSVKRADAGKPTGLAILMSGTGKGRKVLFVHHKAGKPPVLEAIAKTVSRKTADTGASAAPVVIA